MLGLLLWVVVRYRQKAHPIPSKTTHNTFIEVVWTLAPVILLVIIAAPSIGLLQAQFKPAPAGAVTLKAVGNQWYWTYQYPDHGGFEITANMLKERNEVGPGEQSLVVLDDRDPVTQLGPGRRGGEVPARGMDRGPPVEVGIEPAQRPQEDAQRGALLNRGEDDVHRPLARTRSVGHRGARTDDLVGAREGAADEIGRRLEGGQAGVDAPVGGRDVQGANHGGS